MIMRVHTSNDARMTSLLEIKGQAPNSDTGSNAGSSCGGRTDARLMNSWIDLRLHRFFDRYLQSLSTRFALPTLESGIAVGYPTRRLQKIFKWPER